MELTTKWGIMALDPGSMRKQPQPRDIDIAIAIGNVKINNKQQTINNKINKRHLKLDICPPNPSKISLRGRGVYFPENPKIKVPPLPTKLENTPSIRGC